MKRSEQTRMAMEAPGVLTSIPRSGSAMKAAKTFDCVEPKWRFRSFCCARSPSRVKTKPEKRRAKRLARVFRSGDFIRAKKAIRQKATEHNPAA